MDNLEQLRCLSKSIYKTEYGKPMVCCFHEEITCFVTELHYLCIYESSIDKFCTFLGTDIEVNQVHYLSMYDGIFLATDKTICLFNCNVLKSSICYEGQCCITTVSWAPMEIGLVILIDENGDITLCSFTGDLFKIKYKTHLNAIVPNSVFVGWGSQSTQFNRSSNLRNNTFEAELLTYSSPTVAWRDNGQQFVVNFFKEGTRYLKVFDSDLNPLYMSEGYINLQSPVYFMCQGIACCASRNNVNEVIIFEKNCKEKSKFDVPENKGKIKKLLFHPQMNILAVHSVNDYDYISIYSYTNAKWNLKQQLLFSTIEKVVDFTWVYLNESLNTICKLVVITEKDIEFHTFRFIINRCVNIATVAVVDGNIVNFYKYDNKTMPPPMAYISVETDVPVNRISFHPKLLRCILLNAKSQVKIIDLTEDNFGNLLLSGNLDISSKFSYHSMEWTENDRVQIYFESECEKLYNSKFESNGLVLVMTIIKKNSNNILIPYNDTNYLILFKSVSVNFCNLIYLTKQIIKVNNLDMVFEFGLSGNREFYINEKVICNNVTSFLIFKDYLIFTHGSCKLYCMRLSYDYKLLHDTLNLSKIYYREIEQGARIVCINNAEPPKIILQLPRGNLETVGCRMLIIDMIEKLLNENQWLVVINIIRTNRINWNVLVDLNPNRFCNHIEEFVKAAKYCSILNSIVNNFNNTENVYINCWPTMSKIKYNKTDVVEQILKHLITTDCINNFASIVSIQQKHCSLKLALSSIRDVYLTNPKSNDKICCKALKQLFLQAHLKDVLNITYTFFNLEFLSFIYRNTGQDPKFYEHEIATLKALDQSECRFEMCIKGNDKKNAIKYLLRCENVDEMYIKDYIMKHDLESVAYKSLQENHHLFKMVTVIYAKQLSLRKKYMEAAVILKKIGLMEDALEEYKNALNYVEVLHLMRDLHYEKNKQKIILYELSNSLLSKHKIDEAIQLLEHYNHDYETAILTLVKYRLFNKAIALCRIYKATNELGAQVLSNLREYINLLREKIDEYENKFNKYWNRLKAVRIEKFLKLENILVETYDGDDLSSEIGSILSITSSRVTSKSRVMNECMIHILRHLDNLQFREMHIFIKCYSCQSLKMYIIL